MVYLVASRTRQDRPNEGKDPWTYQSTSKTRGLAEEDIEYGRGYKEETEEVEYDMILFAYWDHSTGEFDYSEILCFVETRGISHGGLPAKVAGRLVEVFIDSKEITPISGSYSASSYYAQIDFKPGIPSFGGDWCPVLG